MANLQNKLAEIVKAYGVEDTKVNAMVEDILTCVLQNKEANRKTRPADVDVNGVTYRWCLWARAYFPLEEFVGGANKRNYTKAAEKIWSGFYNSAKKLKNIAIKGKAYGTLSDAEFADAMDKANKLDAQKDDYETHYSHLTKLGKTLEELMEMKNK